MNEALAQALSRLPDRAVAIGLPLLLAAGCIGLALAVHAVALALLRRLAARSATQADDILLRHLAAPTRIAFATYAAMLATQGIAAIAHWHDPLAGFVLPGIAGWIALATLRALVEAAERRADISVPDNRDARRRRTRLALLGRIAAFAIVFVTIGMMLLAIPGVRAVGVTLMASAGLATLAVGAAAQPALKSLIAGFQMALTQPISIDDVVVIDGEWGRIEDIRSSHVVVRLWDERRLMVPTARFLEDTFENWTRNGAALLAPVILHLDPLADIAPMRAEFLRALGEQPLWDGRVGVLQVTEARAEAIEVRLLMSARDSGSAFDLRCAMREAMLAWLRDNQPGAIPRQRWQRAGGGGNGDDRSAAA